MYPITLAWRLRERRKMLALTQAQVADKAGITQPALSMLEKEIVLEPNHDTQQALCAALYCDYRWLIKGMLKYAPKGFYSAYHTEKK